MAVTGKGNFPFNSRWVNGRKKDALRKQIFWADKDQSIQTIMVDWFFESAGPTYYGILKWWSGSSWINKPLKVYLAGSWQSKPVKRWNGSEWLLIDST